MKTLLIFLVILSIGFFPRLPRRQKYIKLVDPVPTIMCLTGPQPPDDILCTWEVFYCDPPESKKDYQIYYNPMMICNKYDIDQDNDVDLKDYAYTTRN